MVARWRLLLAVLVGLLALGPTTTTTASAATLAYDAPAIARVDVQTNEADCFEQALVSDTQAEFAPAPVRGTSTTPSSLRNATNTADDLAGAACRTNSFVPGTKVLMADGTRRPIEDIEVGDMVLATDPETGERGPRRVIDTIVGDGVKELVDVEVRGAVVTATDLHPFWVDDRGEWVDAGDLEVGDELTASDGTTVVVEGVGERVEVRRVHNLTVEGIHTYFVIAGSHEVLVHNCIRNGHLAGQTHPSTGVPFDDAGFPDFSAWRHPDVADVRIQLSGSRSTDFARADAAAGITGQRPAGYTWHHHQDSGLMQLVDSRVHAQTGHTGGFSGAG
jgi:hypothetical protein